MFAIPAVGLAVIALVALLLLYGAKYFAQFISHLIPRNLPVIGSAISDAVASLASHAISTIEGWLDAAVRPLAAVITAPVAVVRGLFDAIYTALAALTGRVAWIVTTRIPATLRAAKAYTVTKVATLAAWTTAKVAQLLTAIAVALVAAKAYAFTLYRQGIAYTVAKVETLASWTTAKIAQLLTAITVAVAAAEHLAAAQLARAVTTLHAGITRVENYAHAAYADTLGRIASLSAFLQHYADTAAAAAVADATAVLDASITAGMTDVWHGVTAEISELEGVIAGDFPDILAGLRDIDLSIPRDVAGAVTGAAAISIPMLRYLKQCGLNNCRNLGGLGKDLQALFGLVDDVALLGLVVGLVTDPRGTAHEIESVTSGIVESVMHEASNLFGVG